MLYSGITRISFADEGGVGNVDPFRKRWVGYRGAP
jgi:hypothetical protein